MEARRQITSWNTQTSAGARQAGERAAAMIFPAVWPCLTSAVLLLAELLPVWLSVRRSVCLSAGRFRKPSPARHNTGLPPSLSPACMSRAAPVLPGQRFDYVMEGRGERKKGEKGMREKGERKRYSQSSNRPLRCSLSPVPTLCVCRSIRAAPSCCRCSMTSSSTRQTPSLPVRSFEIKP